jgi:PAS domain S-box-containing protein
VLDFPFQHALALGSEPRWSIPAAGKGPRPRLDWERYSLAEFTQRTLLEGHTPPAVTVDREGRIVFYHGDTRPFLEQLTGEPTRELMLLAREGVLGVARAALHRAVTTGDRAVATDGWVELEAGRRVRVSVTASPLESDDSPAEASGGPGYFVISFSQWGDLTSPGAQESAGGQPESLDELRRLRAELQGTIEELQTSNEELKASHEEVMSVNEEYQSSNEELETSKEEMQSLNEELTTVNTQLRSKMDELQATSGDLTSLLASTDIGVLFLDTELRIRRYTSAIRSLVDLIATDVGRPLSALARRFDDPHLDDDVRDVLDRLAPIEREISGEGRYYLRRVLPYRTSDNRIDGVVVTFVDITALRNAEKALRESEGRFRALVEPFAQSTWEADAEGMRVVDSPSWRAYTGQTLDECLGEAWANAIHPDDREAAMQKWREALRSGSLFDAEYRLRTVRGEWRWTYGRAAPLRETDGSIRKWVGMNVDISTRKEAESALAAELAAMTALHELSERLMVVADTPTAMNEVLRLAIGLHGADRGSVQFYDPVAGALRFAASSGFDPKALAKLPEIDRNYHSTCAAAIRTGKRVVVTDFRSDPAFAGHREAAEMLGYRAAISTPMMTRQGEFQGVLTVHFRDPHVPKDRELRQTDLYARLAAHLIERGRDEVAIRESQERLQLALSAARMGIWLWDVERDIHTRDANLNQLLGLAAVETRLTFADFLDRMYPDDREFASISFQSSARSERPLNIEFRIVTPDGRVRWLRDQGDVFHGEGDALQMAGVCVDVTDLKEAEAAIRHSRDEMERRVADRTAELATANEALREGMNARTELLRRLVSAQEDERRRVARDLHDSLGQEVTALTFSLGALEEAVPKNSPASERLREVQEMVARIGQQAHDLAIDLRPTALDDLGLLPALSAYTRLWSERTGITADFESQGIDGARFSPETETTIYRAVQEALNNVAKHAEAQRVSVILERRDGELTALVEDDGRGFDPANLKSLERRGLGLVGMRERVSLAGGNLLIESGEGKGTTVRVRLAVDPTAEEAGHDG